MAQSWLHQRGFGWAFEVEPESDDEPQRPLLEELEINPRDILQKAKWALLPPKDGVGQLADFWGPITVILTYSALIVWGQLAALSWVLSIWTFGSFVLFAIAHLLGADTTFSHTLGALGYCMLPLVVCRLILLLAIGDAGVLSLLIRAIAIAWSTHAASCWLQTRELANKQLLLAYPIMLYNFYLAALSTGV